MNMETQETQNSLNNYSWNSRFLISKLTTQQQELRYSVAGNDGEALYSQQKQDRELTVAQITNSLLPNSDLNWRK